ncbi:MAG: hypothetical protein KF836_12165 [Fimbriimonadaceae bacterium]|nr:hypothetical protein [Fimbriimonadaceae bacterium]
MGSNRTAELKSAWILTALGCALAAWVLPTMFGILCLLAVIFGIFGLMSMIRLPEHFIDPTELTFRIGNNVIAQGPIECIQVMREPIGYSVGIVKNNCIHKHVMHVERSQAEHLANLIRYVLTPEPEQTNETSPSQI